MTLTLTLSPDREVRLQEQAQQAGLTPEEYALRVLDHVIVPVPSGEQTDKEPPPQTLTDLLAGHIGAVASGRGDLSEDTGKKFAQKMQDKRKAGRL